MSQIAKNLSSEGEEKLQEAVLIVLTDSYNRGECVGPAHVSKEAGIFKDGGNKGKKVPWEDKSGTFHDAIASGILYKLKLAGKVERCRQSEARDGWTLTKDEYRKRSKR